MTLLTLQSNIMCTEAQDDYNKVTQPHQLYTCPSLHLIRCRIKGRGRSASDSIGLALSRLTGEQLNINLNSDCRVNNAMEQNNFPLSAPGTRNDVHQHPQCSFQSSNCPSSPFNRTGPLFWHPWLRRLISFWLSMFGRMGRRRWSTHPSIFNSTRHESIFSIITSAGVQFRSLPCPGVECVAKSNRTALNETGTDPFISDHHNYSTSFTCLSNRWERVHIICIAI